MIVLLRSAHRGPSRRSGRAARGSAVRPAEPHRRALDLRSGGWLIILLLLAGPVGAAAQSIELRRSGFALPEPGACGEIAIQNTTSPGSSAVIDSLLAAGSRAAILGEHRTAADLLREAAVLDPLNPIVSYRLARTLDDQGDPRAARVEYCRYVALAPMAADAPEIRNRIRDLALDGFAPPPDPWRAAGAAGIAAFDARRYAEAVTAFGIAIDLRPDSPDAFFNRAAAHLRLRQDAAAIRDLESYLALQPATDSVAVFALESLRSRADAVPEAVTVPFDPVRGQMTLPAPGSALIQGLLLPGLGQHATGRTDLGLVVLTAAAGAVYYGSRPRIVTRLIGEYDPFGNFYEYEVNYRERPNRIPGYALAAGIGLAGALESFLYAGRHQRAARAGSPTARVGPLSVALSVTATLAGPALTVRIPTGAPGRQDRSRGP